MIKYEVKNDKKDDVSILLRFDNHNWCYLCECGYSENISIKDYQKIKAVFVSHTHLDHFINFDQIIRHQLGLSKTIVVCGPENIAKQVQAKLLGYTWNIIDSESLVYEVREISEDTIKRYLITPPEWKINELDNLDGGRVFEEENFYVDCVVLDHKVPSIAYRFDERDSINIDLSKTDLKPGKWIQELKDAFTNASDSILNIYGNEFYAKDLFELLKVKKGDSLGIIMDHAANHDNQERINTLFSSCNTVLIESFYKVSDKHLANEHFHSYSEKSGEVMKSAGVKNPVPIHFSRKYSDDEIEELIFEFYKAYNNQRD